MGAKKLTLRLNEEVIRQGKAYARQQGTSLSRMLEEAIKTKLQERAAYAPVRRFDVSNAVKSIGIRVPGYDDKSDREMMDIYLQERYGIK